jgi:hypothetical protein
VRPLAVACFLGLIACRAAAGDAGVLRTELDAVVALQLPSGGWTYWSPAGTRPRALTFGLGWAERIAGPLGLATWDTIVVRSPGTPAAGLALVAGHRRTGDARYLAAARRAGDLLLALELPGGGWFSEMPASGGRLAWWFPWVIPGPSIDDDVTPGAVRFLLALWQATGDARYRAGAERGVEVLRRAQLPDGAWPLCARPAWLRWLRPGYEDQPTLNDAATTATLTTLLVAARALERPALAAAAARAGEWLVRARGAPPRAAWAQQYDAQDRPAGARRFEPPALATWESRHAVDALLALAADSGDGRWCAPVPDAVAWLEHAALRPGCWARLHHPDDGTPVYVDAAGRRVATPEAARPGYSWTGDFGIPWVLARLGRPLPPGVVATPLVDGDPGVCPGTVPTGMDAGRRDDARAAIARASSALARLEPPPAACR